MTEAQVEAWVRKKPRRILQNQVLIEALAIVAGYTTIVLPFLILWLISLFPSAVSVAVIVWFISCIGYCAVRIYAKIRYPA